MNTQKHHHVNLNGVLFIHRVFCVCVLVESVLFVHWGGGGYVGGVTYHKTTIYIMYFILT